jgi:hypothetical protein
MLLLSQHLILSNARSLIRRVDMTGTGDTSSQPAILLDDYEVSSVSEHWSNQVVYAIFTSKSPSYHDNLRAQLDTWAKKPHSEGRFVAVAGRDYPQEWQEPGRILASNCEDGPDSLSCKEAKLIAEGGARGAAWIFIIGEDNSVDTNKLEAFLATRSVDSPEAWGAPGCGAHLGQFCPDVDKNGGFCGGAGYALNRAVLAQLLSKGVPALNKEYNHPEWPNDMMTSCALRQRNIKLGLKDQMYGNPYFGKSEYMRTINDGFITLHYVKPPTMRWIHAVRNNDTSSAESLVASTFEGPGCEIGKQKGHEDEYNACLEQEAKKEKGSQ